MKVSHLTSAEVAARAVGALGLDPEVVEFGSAEAICAALRRAASFLCPASPRQLADAVGEAIAPLSTGGSPAREEVMAQLELLVAAGDFLELSEASDRSTRRIYLGPPAFVCKAPGLYLLLGVRPYGAPLVDSTLSSQILHEGHTRTLELAPESASDRLAAAGLHELSLDQWLEHPAPAAPDDVFAEFRLRLSAAGPAGQVDGLKLLDPAAPVRFYRGRWRDPRADDDGDFVARRPQAYGADLWCAARLHAGQPAHLIDLPLDPTAVGRDEAWRLQAAIDATRGTPQQYRTHRASGCGDAVLVDLFGPVPTWAERRVELVGLPVSRSTGALLSYRVPAVAVGDVEAFLAGMLWMTRSPDGGTA